jgi:predicted aminopeptidase
MQISVICYTLRHLSSYFIHLYMVYLRRIRLFLSYLLLVLACTAVFNYELSTYLLRQARGQWDVLRNTETFEEFESYADPNAKGLDNLKLINKIKQFSVDSLGYKPTENFTSIYDQRSKPILWVVTASEKYSLKPVEWKFPLIGNVSYKGYFNEALAQKEKIHLQAQGYDAGIRSVSAWSTLGWFKDPILSSHLKKTKGSFCNLLFHELFHATFYEASRINDNENLANFIAHKATLLFLKNDTVALREYLNDHSEREKLNQFLNTTTKAYKNFLDSISSKENKLVLKQKELRFIIKKLKNAGIKREKIILMTEQEILLEQNAYFIDYMQYNSKQDSLEKAFNKFYGGSIKNMVRSLAP